MPWHTFDHHSSCLLRATPLGTSTANWPGTASNITILMLHMAKTSGIMMHTNPFSKVALRRNTSKACKNPTSNAQADSSSVAKHMQMVYKRNQSDAPVVSQWPYQHMQLQYSKSLRLGLPQWPRAHSSYPQSTSWSLANNKLFPATWGPKELQQKCSDIGVLSVGFT